MAEEGATVLVQKRGEGTRIPIEKLFEPLKRKVFDTKNTEGREKTGETEALSKRMVRRIVESLKPREGQLGAGHVQAVRQPALSVESGTFLPPPSAVHVHSNTEPPAVSTV